MNSEQCPTSLWRKKETSYIQPMVLFSNPTEKQSLNKRLGTAKQKQDHARIKTNMASEKTVMLLKM